ncbi:Omp28-related outer membrane protein [Taibaiella soli]|uniref:Outer membrane protein Omp28 n=1 Tax=Taibaiella soli TaxID=1649169 RepID=A0A2W2A824_9BACT|nr:Omp28-related outer membrane protein [Taibaiella soli]PZF71505.1 hypothetical protein DN068_17830 [Taibaiella soli]
MKKLALIAVSGIVALASCKEVGPTIDFAKKVDSTYTATVETPQNRNVMIEEFTGVTCANCPAGHAMIEGFEAKYPNRIIEARIYPFNFGQATPTDVTKQDFRTQKGTDLAFVFFGGLSFMPACVIDRVPVNNQIMVSSPSWSDQVDKRIATVTPLNMYITSAYDAGSKTANITVKTAITQDIAKKLNLTVAIVEDSIIDAQEYPSTTDTFYMHQSVLRDFVTDYTGSEILPGLNPKPAGQVYIRYFSYKLSNDAWVPEHCRVIAWISNNEGKDIEVAQSVVTHVK